MLRIYFLQQRYGLGDAALEDARYDSQALPDRDPVPDATTLLKFRHGLGHHELTKALLDEGGTIMEERGLLMRQGTIVDTTIIVGPPSIKNKSTARDPEMYPTKKGNQRHFGIEAQVGINVASGLVHKMVRTAADEVDITLTTALPHGREEAVFGDAGCTGADKRPEFEDRDVSWNIAIKPNLIKALPKAVWHLAKPVEWALVQVRAVVEHPFHVLKNPGLRRGRIVPAQ